MQENLRARGWLDFEVGPWMKMPMPSLSPGRFVSGDVGWVVGFVTCFGSATDAMWDYAFLVDGVYAISYKVPVFHISVPLPMPSSIMIVMSQSPRVINSTIDVRSLKAVTYQT